VLPALAGAWELFGHVPSIRGAPENIDSGDEANLIARATPLLRLHPTLVAAWPNCRAQQHLLEFLSPESLANRFSEPEFIKQLRDTLVEVGEEPTLPKWLRDTARALARFGGRLVSHLTPYPGPITTGIVLHSPKHLPEYAKRWQSSFTDEDDSSSIGTPRALHDHCEDVASQLRRFTSVCSVPASAAADAVLAATLHDLGKLILVSKPCSEAATSEPPANFLPNPNAYPPVAVRILSRASAPPIRRAAGTNYCLCGLSKARLRRSTKCSTANSSFISSPAITAIADLLPQSSKI
jgi:hypothetical protein